MSEQSRKPSWKTVAVNPRHYVSSRRVSRFHDTVDGLPQQAPHAPTPVNKTPFYRPSRSAETAPAPPHEEWCTADADDEGVLHT
jgi:hypothetical protein